MEEIMIVTQIYGCAHLIIYWSV